MDQEKPFKTIEVVDSRTNQVCKVACMSCIRGHRTTSCGIPVCRTKVFWTVKRPGRPSNSCTCRYGATGGCKCVVAKAACPHKSKKGEKRSGECRCDEQGRYCCLIEPEQWALLLSLQKPTVDFYQTREALEARHLASNPTSYPTTPAYTALSPHPSDGVSSVAPATPNAASMQGMTPGLTEYPQSPSGLTAHFGILDLSASMSQTPGTRADQTAWNSSPEVMKNAVTNQYAHADTQSEQSSCCQQSSSPAPYAIQSPHTQVTSPFGTAHHLQPDATGLDLHNGQGTATNMPAQTSIAPVFDFDRLQADYFRYQFPSAICQNCGLNGCTCRNCPPVFQNFGTSTWAQYCGRKHARDAQPAPSPIPTKIARSEPWTAENGLRSVQDDMPMDMDSYLSHGSYAVAPDLSFNMDMNGLPITRSADAAAYHSFGNLGNDYAMPDVTGQFDISELLLSDLDRDADDSGGGGCCGGR